MSIKIHKEPRLRNPYLLVSWNPDIAGLGARVAGYLKKAIAAQVCCEIDPLGFFAMSGVTIERDLVQFPGSKLFFNHGHELLIFESMQPQRRQYQFLSLLLDMAENFNVKQVYTIGGLASGIAHSAKRRIFTVSTRPGLKKGLTKLGLETEMYYQGPPSINSSLLWVVRNRGLDGISLWQEIPFYLATVGDWRATKTLVELLAREFGLHLDPAELDLEIASQENRIEQLRQQSSEIDGLMRRLEAGKELAQDEAQKLAGEVAEFLGAG
ncbi:MAG: PAC2 family protein [Chloroflexi bacterium]|nr:PAC2 family protein [Chloroflexota bacterium]